MKGFRLLGIIIAVSVLLAAGIGGGLYWNEIQKVKSIQRGCTQEAKFCPDGSAVGRTGPNCEFAECPASDTRQETGDMSEWKTYRNEKYGFEVRYPAKWELREHPDRLNGAELEIINSKRFADNSRSLFYVSPGAWPLILPPVRNTSRNIIISGKQARVTSYLTDDDEEWAWYIVFSTRPLVWDENGYIFIETGFKQLKRECIGPPIEEIGCEGGWKYFGDIDSIEKETLEKILSTFKFIE